MDTSYISELQRVDTPTLSNAIELLEIRDKTEGYCDNRLRCLFPQLGRMVGYAVTATVDSSTPGPTRNHENENFARLFEAVEAAPKPVVMVFQEIGARPRYGCHCGEVMATIGKRLGVVGVVSDAGVRDIDEVLALGVHYFAEGCIPSHGHQNIREVNVPVEVAGMDVLPGDLLHGDINGLIKVPPELRGELSELLDQIRSSERGVMEMTKADSFGATDLSAILRVAH
jgi:4-hydroxy-4-methyl-2-oxoglutarate aldolase